jgi:hypothetical protein
MVTLLLGIGAAVVASSLYSVGVALQALEARQVHADHGLRLSLFRQLARRGRWLAATALSTFGWPFQVAALLLAPLVVVQPALAAGLLVLLGLGHRILGEHAGRSEKLAMAAIVVGVAGLAWTAPERTTTHAHGAIFPVTLGLLWLVAFGPYLLRLLGRTWGTLTMVSAGLGFAWGGVATKLVADEIARGHWVRAVAWGFVSTATEVVALLSEMSALQTRPAIQVAPVVFVVQTLVPVALAPLLVHEHFSRTPLHGVPLLASLLILALGAAYLARSPLLLALTAGGDQASADSGAARSPAERKATVRPSSEALEPS